MVVMYTLRTMAFRKGRKILAGPINRKVYASFAPKRHAFAIARREANKRGFGPDSGKVIQIVTDGDDDLGIYARDHFPEAIHTLDLYHAKEYLWKAGECLLKEGSEELKAWVKRVEGLILAGKAKQVVEELRREAKKIPRRGPWNINRRKRIESAADYLGKRTHMMDYPSLRARDLEIASGSIEGAVKHVIGKRFDNGSMRWIRERAEALLQLRCIEVNGDWDQFIEFVHEKIDQELKSGTGCRVLSWIPGSLPTLGFTA
jgi:polyhydroxyalkanoate synthesis regulator phasin